MSPTGRVSGNGSGTVATHQEAAVHRLGQVSWEELLQSCLRLAAQLLDADRPEVVVALARAGYVPGAILASVLRCELLTLSVPPTRDNGRLKADPATFASLRLRLGGRRVLVLDETTRTGQSLAWAVLAITNAGAAMVRTAVLFRSPGSPPPDYCAAVADGHFLQPWIPYCV